MCYSIEIAVAATAGYTFTGYDESNITFSINGTACTVDDMYIYADVYGSYIDIHFDLPLLNEDHKHNYVWNDDESGHWQYCDICDKVDNNIDFDHVYDNADDPTCNDCGYVRKLYVNQIDLTLSGYEIDKKVKDITLSATDSSSKYIAYDKKEGRYYLGMEGLACYTYGKENGSYMTFTSDSDLTFRPGTDYQVGIAFKLDGAYALSSDAVITLDGVEVNQVITLVQSGEVYAIAIAMLPVLEGESEKTTISGAKFTFTGYEIGAKLSDTALTLEGADGIGDYGAIIYDGDDNLLYAPGNTTDEVFQKEEVYYILVVMQAKDGYTFYGTLPTNIEINGVNAVEYSSVKHAGDDDDYDKYSYYTAIGLECSLPVLTDESHEHSYGDTYGYDANSHWYYCDVCRHKKDVAEHVYANAYDLTCEICGYERTIEVTSITLYLRTYTYGQLVGSLWLEHYVDGVEPYRAGYGSDYNLSTDIGIASGYSSNYMDDNDLLQAGVKYYLQAILTLKNGYGINNIEFQNIVLDGYGTAIAMLESSGNLYITFELSALEEPHVHEGTWYAEVSATCITAGTNAHRHCDTCGKDFDADGREITDLTIAINPDAHSFGTWVPEDPATCVSEGTKAHKDCTLCKRHFDAEGNEISNLTIVIDATAHGTSLVKVEAVPATAGSVGNIEYYYCASCGKYYSDVTVMTEISLADMLVGKLAPTVIEGNDGEWSDDAQSSLAFKSDALPEDFIGITVDGIEVSPDNYVVGTDALTIMLKPEFLATLTDGDHTIVISSESGQATATFKVTAVVTPGEDNGSDDGDEGLSAGAWVGIAFGIAGGVAGIAIGVWYLFKYLKRRKTPMPIRAEAPAEPHTQPSTEENTTTEDNQ